MFFFYNKLYYLLTGRSHMKTLVVCILKGCGKIENTDKKYKIYDAQALDYNAGEIRKIKNDGMYDFIFLPYTEKTIIDLLKQEIPFVTVQPNNIIWDEDETPERRLERQRIKECWLGKAILDGEITPNNISEEIEFYDKISAHNYYREPQGQLSFFTLELFQTVEDILDNLYNEKEEKDIY